MDHEASIGHLKGLKISRNNPAIHHLLFADDLLIFGQASPAEAATINSCLTKYCSWSGQSINSHKCSISFSKNTNPATAASILLSLPYNPNPSTYIHLGLPIFLGISKRAAFQNILDQVHKKIDSWRAKTLSQASRLVLIKAVAAAIPAYSMSSFMLPASICSKLDQAFKNFWWGFPPSQARNLSLKSWSSLCLPKDVGGLGFRKMQEVNLAFISKLGWKLHNNSNSLWTNQLRGKYLSTRSFLSPSSHSSPSGIWKGILSSQSIISLGACHRIHKHSPLNIWHSP
jgi:hypothetical protein